jgi:hypothetical protein
VRKLIAGLLAFLLLHSSLARAAAWPGNVTPADREYLRDLMRETWSYIDRYLSPVTGLPYDSSEARDITNTTNIGLYLASLCMAYRLGYVTEEHALARITKILDSLDTYENWDRLYGNWLDPDGINRKAKPGESNISDYNKLPAGLIVVRRTFPPLADRCTAFLDQIPWEKFLEESTGKIRYAFDVSKKEMHNPVNFYRGEDKILGHFLMIAWGKAPASTWDQHDLSKEERYGIHYYKFGWQGGGLFMQFICDLFLDNRGTSLGLSSANFAWAQIVHGLKIGSPVWGWSACIAPNGTYLGMNMLVDEVVTPHASALAISLFPREVIDNLKRLETFGLREPRIVDGVPERFGFRDAVNWRNGQIADKYLILDQAMLFLSLVNYCERGLLWRTFGSDPQVIEGKKRITDYRQAKAKRAEQARYIQALEWKEPGCFWLSENTGATYRPGDLIQRTLWARSLASAPITNAVQRWTLTAAGGMVVTEDELPVVLAPRQTLKSADVVVETESARYGTAWTFDLSLLAGGVTVCSNSESLRFPGFLSLDKRWRRAPGDQPEWADPAFDDSAWTPARVGVRWEDDGLADYDSNGWYRVHFKVPAAMQERWKDQPLAVALGAIDDADETYLNGRKIGQTGKFPPDKETAYNTPRVYEFDRALLVEDNVLAVRVGDWGGNGGIWREPVAVGPAAELRDVIEETR